MIHPRHIWSIPAALGMVALSSCNQESSVKSKTEETVRNTPDLEQFAKLHGKVTFTLEDGESLNREYPDTFRIPPKERRENLVRDDLVKLVFNLTDGRQTQVERMWVVVKSGDSSEYIGTLDNNPYCTDQITAGLEVSFAPRHVIEIWEDESPGNAEAGQDAALKGQD